MPGFISTIGTFSFCPHGGKVTLTSTGPRVLIGGQPVVTVADRGIVTGCTATPQCTVAQFLVASTRIFIMGKPAILNTSTGMCMPAGAPIITVNQPRVGGI